LSRRVRTRTALIGAPPQSEAETRMTQLERFSEIIATYRKHGWHLKRILIRTETRAAAFAPAEGSLFEGVEIKEAPVDALWFARASHAGREAWELRLVAEPPYALFETFERDEAEEEREDVRREMEARLHQYVEARG
jgi:hypothetical protein